MKKSVLCIALAAAMLGGAAVTAHAADLQPLVQRAANGDTAAMVQLGERLLMQGEPVQALVYLEHVVRLGRPIDHVARAHAAIGGHYASLRDNPAARGTAMAHYQQAVALGHTASQVRLGRLYLEDAATKRGTERDLVLDRALVLLEYAASREQNTEAAYLLGYGFLNGWGFKKNTDVGAAWLRFGADHGHQAAALAIGRYELSQRRASTAEHYLGIAARGGSGEAAMLLANAYSEGKLVPKDLAAAARWANEASALGVPEATALLARLQPAAPAEPIQPVLLPMPVPLLGTPQSAPPASTTVAGAFNVTPQGATQVLAAPPIPAPASDAETTRLRELEAQNAELAAKLTALQQQVEQLAPVAKAEPKTQATATVTAPAPRSVAAATAPAPAPAIAADASSTTAAAADAEPAKASGPDIGERIRSLFRRQPSPNEKGLAAHAAGNYPEASVFFARAARSGDVDAMNNLGMLYLQGKGVAQNRAKAMELFRQAASEGHAVAARNIAYMYHHGLGVSQDLARATMWVRHANTLERRQVSRGAYAHL